MARTVSELLRWRARQHPDRVAIRHAGRTSTYAELDRAANRVAQALLAGGLRPGDRVAILDKGHDRFFEVLFGTVRAGGVYPSSSWAMPSPTRWRRSRATSGI